MSDPNLEPLPPECEALLGRLPKPAVAAELKARAWERIAASAAAMPMPSPGEAGGAPGAESPSAGGAGVAAGGAGTGGLGVAGAVLGKWGAPLALAALVGGVGAGVAVDRAVFPPEPKVVVRTEVLRVPAAPEPTPVAPAPPPTAPAPPRPRVVKPVTPEPTPPVIELPSSEERQLLELARTALLKRDSRAALDAVAKHRSAFARGQLSEERDSLEVQALAQAGKAAEAREAAARFAQTYPESVFGPAVEAAVRP